MYFQYYTMKFYFPSPIYNYSYCDIKFRCSCYSRYVIDDSKFDMIFNCTICKNTMLLGKTDLNVL